MYFWSKEEVKYLENNFSTLSDIDISKKLKKSPNAIRIKASRLNIRSASSVYRFNLQLSKIEEQVILGGLLGDLHCRITHTSKNARLEGGHTLKQKEYLMYKVNLLQKLRWYIRLGKKNDAYFYQSRAYPCLNQYHDIFYSFGNKRVTKPLLDRLDTFGLFIWYMDDGSYSKRDNISSLYTNCFSYEEQKVIKEWFEEKWGISPHIYNAKNPKKYPGKIWYYLYFPVRETRKLHDLFINFSIPECMKYKFSFYNQDHTYQQSHLWGSNAHNEGDVEKRTERNGGLVT